MDRYWDATCNYFLSSIEIPIMKGMDTHLSVRSNMRTHSWPQSILCYLEWFCSQKHTLLSLQAKDIMLLKMRHAQMKNEPVPCFLTRHYYFWCFLSVSSWETLCTETLSKVKELQTNFIKFRVEWGVSAVINFSHCFHSQHLRWKYSIMQVTFL